MTQEEFAERIGISQNYLSTMERGKVEIGAEILIRISREFVKSVEWLLRGRARQTEYFCWRRSASNIPGFGSVTSPGDVFVVKELRLWTA
jgi:transcriptional regulator with XRE-family HTH domain